MLHDVCDGGHGGELHACSYNPLWWSHVRTTCLPLQPDLIVMGENYMHALTTRFGGYGRDLHSCPYNPLWWTQERTTCLPSQPVLMVTGENCICPYNPFWWSRERTSCLPLQPVLVVMGENYMHDLITHFGGHMRELHACHYYPFG